MENKSSEQTIDKQNKETNETKCSSDLMEATGLPNTAVAEILSYLPSEEPLLSTTAGLRFFKDRDRVFIIKLRDEYRVAWQTCQEYLGAENMCLPSVAYQHLTNCYYMPGWDFDHSDDTPLVSMSHPYLPACVLKCLPKNKEHLNNLLLTWGTCLTGETWRYGMRLACLAGNLDLVQALTIHCRPSKDNLNTVIRCKYLTLVQYILDNKKFGVTACAYSFQLAVESGDLAIFQYMFSTLPQEYQSETRQRALMQIQQMLEKDKDSANSVQDIVHYLSEENTMAGEPLNFKI